MTIKEKMAFKLDQAKWAVKQTGYRVKESGKNLLHYCAEHPMVAIAITSAAATGIQKGTKLWIDHTETVRRDRSFWDPRVGKYTKIRRKLKPYEQVQAEARFKAGEGWSEIFADMDLLK
jgi:hypothetical protein